MVADIAISALLIAFTAFFVATEFAMVRTRRTRVEQLADEGGSLAGWLLPLVSSRARLADAVTATQIGVTATGLGLGFFGADRFVPPLVAWLERLGASEGSVDLAVTVAVLVVLSIVQIVLGEQVPKSLAIRYPDRIAMLAAIPLRLAMRPLGPAIRALGGAGNAIARVIDGSSSEEHEVGGYSAQEIALLVAESGAAGTIEPAEEEMLQNAFDLSQLVARQVMIPRNKVQMADVSSPVEMLLRRLVEAPFSRLPVFESTPDHVLGIVHLKDVYSLYMAGETAAGKVVREVPFVPETMPVTRVWQTLNSQRAYLAIVLDEHGGTSGIVTQADLLEEIFGTVGEETGAPDESEIRRPDGAAEVPGDTLVTALNDAFDLELPQDQADTVAGLIMDELGRLASAGDVVALPGVILTVLSLSGRSVAKVLVEPVAKAPPQGSGGD